MSWVGCMLGVYGALREGATGVPAESFGEPHAKSPACSCLTARPPLPGAVLWGCAPGGCASSPLPCQQASHAERGGLLKSKSMSLCTAL